MCGIVGIYLKNKKYNSQLGKFLTGMMNNMATRGPDSAGLRYTHLRKKRNINIQSALILIKLKKFQKNYLSK